MTEHELPAAHASARERGRRRAPAQASPHAHSFRTATAFLVALAIGALVVAGAIAAGGRHGSSTAARWSAWSPPDSGALGARDIADYIAPFYRLSAVDQLDVVTVVNLQSAAAAQAAAEAQAVGTSATGSSSGLEVAVRPSPSSSAVSLLSGNTIAYNLCGIGGKNCAIGVGRPSTDRLLLLRREALELALYTFKYISATDNVLAILPPGRAGETSTLTSTLTIPDAPAKTVPIDIAVLFVRSELQPLLTAPLTDTLPETIPPTIAEMPDAPEAGLVDQVTARGLFSEQLQEAQDGSDLIVLSPLPPQ
ncbi:MAG: hypothetical protein ACLP50_31390 [Solirubrobacteraceae bacterium]